MKQKNDIIDIFLKDIDISSKRFDRYLFSYNRDFRDVMDSINDVGLINPVILQKREEESTTYTVVCGYQRIRAFEGLKSDKIPAIVLDNVSEEELILLSLHDNLFSRGFNEIEKAIVIKKFLDIGYSQERIISEINTRLNMPQNKKLADKYLLLLGLEEEIKDSVSKNEIEIEKALLLYELDATDRVFVYDLLFKEVNVNLNEVRETIRSLIDLKQMKQQEITEIMTANEVVNIIKDQRLNKRKKGESIYNLIKRMRYPVISEQEESFSESCKALKLDSNIRINHSRYFEQNDIQVTIKSSNDKKLEDDLNKLLNNVKNGMFKRILSISRCSDEFSALTKISRIEKVSVK